MLLLVARVFVCVLLSVSIEIYIHFFPSSSLHLPHYLMCRLIVCRTSYWGCMCIRAEHWFCLIFSVRCWSIEKRKYEKLKPIYLHETNEISAFTAHQCFLQRLNACKRGRANTPKERNLIEMENTKCGKQNERAIQRKVFGKLNPY